MTFRRYDHLERLDHPEVTGILLGTVYVFPKLDGTNASMWHGGAGSRNRTISVESDNHGFAAWTQSDDPKAVTMRDFLANNPSLIVYGEWLVPHSLKTYRSDAWRRFYVFDVYDTETGYLSYREYSTLFNELDIDYIMPFCTIENPSVEQLQRISDNNTYLIQDGEGVGEGIVCKNYLWTNEFGRQPWAKLVRAEFKERNLRAFGPSELQGEKQVEFDIVEELATRAFIQKEYDKLASEGLAREVLIPRLLSTIYNTFLKEEIWTIVKKFKNPTVDFKLLNKYLTIKIKKVLPIFN